MNRITLKRNWVHLLWLFILMYPILLGNLGFLFLGHIINSSLILITAIGGWKSISNPFQYTNLLHKHFFFLYSYNILLFLIGFIFIPNLLYLKFYISFFICILSFSMFYYFNENLLRTFDFIQKLFNYVLPLFLIILIGNYFGSIWKYDVFYLSLFTILYLFAPIKSKKMIGILITFSLFSIILNTGFRALILLNLMGLLVLLLRIMTNIPIRVIKLVTYVTLGLPIIVVVLSVVTGWNPFTALDGSSTQSFSLAGEKINVAGDSRSFLYEEIYNHLCKYDALLWGTTPGIGYQSTLMHVNAEFYNMLKEGRIHTEVGILEFFHFGGIINVALLFSVFVSAVRMIFKSARNRLAYIAALYLSLRWCFLFIEGEINMVAQWLGLFVVLGCFSNKQLLNCTDKQLNILFNRYFMR